ncbi:MAG: DUF433 domain-containing protein [Deltaproteobacteria bacterium]|nr:DUF433 domain-containing protein [Deltaproteobacteria bacterium]
MGWAERIALDPAVLAGKPVVKGTRLGVEFIIDLLAQGWSVEGVLRNYPGLVREDVQACLAYAGEVLRGERVYPLSAQAMWLVTGHQPPAAPRAAPARRR